MPVTGGTMHVISGVCCEEIGYGDKLSAGIEGRLADGYRNVSNLRLAQFHCWNLIVARCTCLPEAS